ncbi:hypothetical protein [Leifsonia sp. Leaf264]|uniref:hypothetical protein n=1 Tax=Leifsonia sp. Leaf264 TaxID=1736314 RepID=UPI0006FE44C2|nr:hypothetical protein [Leifsonia sp. Leaf264]KQO98135.1 hypothetical protein ASF30_08630 [Leifsonia sp. Leaf264]
MSRTDNTTPLWVLMRQPENIIGYRHNCGGWSYGRRERRVAGHQPCDAHEPYDPRGYKRCKPILREELGWQHTGCWGWKRPSNGSRASLGSDRPEIRDNLRQLTKNHRAGADPDDSHIVNEQRRNTVYGWWAD